MKMTGSPAKLITFVASILLVPALVFAAHDNETAATKSAGQKTNASVTSATAPSPTAPVAKDNAKWKEAYGNLPLAFEQNLGQTDSQVQFLARGSGYQIFLTPQETVVALRHAKTANVSTQGPAGLAKIMHEQLREENPSVVRIQLQGANPAPQAVGLDRLPGKTDYFIGNNPKNWRTDVPSFARVEYHDVYPGVDLVFYGKQQRFEYDFIVNPGSDPRAIALHLAGAQKLRLDEQGNLVMDIERGAAELQRPVVYQNLNNERREIAGKYVLKSNGRVTFAIADYDKTQPLIIDPVLNYSTYLGGSALGDVANAIAVDAAGDAYVTGQTNSATFPQTSGAVSSTLAPSGSVFVSELNPTGTALLYSTYLSGDVGEAGFGIALDPAPSANCPNALSAPGVCIYVTGQTFSTVFPTTTANGYNTGTITNPSGTAFVSKINPALSGVNSLVYSSYLGGTNGDYGNAIAVDASSNAYVTGYTNSAPGAVTSGDFTVVGGFQGTLNSSSGNGFLARIDTTQSGTASLIYSTYVGGSGTGAVIPVGDIGSGIAVDTSKNAYIVGTTTSFDFPTTTNAFLQAPFANGANQAVFVSRIDTTKTGAASLIYSTYLASATPTGDVGNAIALGPGNIAYVTGQTSSTSFPVTVAGTTAGQFPSLPAPATGVVFVSLIDTTKSGAASLTYSELLGGTAGDNGLGIRADTLGNAYVAGVTDSANFPLTAGAFQTTLRNVPPNVPVGDAFIAKIAPLGNGASDLLYSTYFGGSGNGGSTPDRAFGIAIDSLNNAYIAGQTASSASSTTNGPYNNFPVFSTGGTAFQTTLTGSDGAAASAAFVAKLTLEPTVAVSPSSLSFTSQVVTVKSGVQTVTLTNNTNNSITMGSAPFITAGSPAASGTDFATTANTCSSSITAGATCSVGVTFTASVPGTETAMLSFTDTDNVNPAQTQNVALSGTSVAANLTLGFAPSTSLTFTSQNVGTTSAAQTVTITNTGNAPIIFNTPSVSITGDYAQTNTCDGATLQPSPATPSSCVIHVTFTPTSASNPRLGTVTIADNGTGNPQTVSLTGTGVALVGALTFAPTSLTFPSQIVGTTSTAQVVTVTNTGTASVTFGASAVSVTGDYSQTNTCNGATLQPSPGTPVSCTISVKFAPTSATNPRTGTVSLTDNATGSPQSINLTGTAAAAVTSVSVTPTAGLMFTSQTVGTTSTPQTVTVTNSGNVPVVFGAPAISITGDYAVSTNTCNGATLQPSPGTPVSCTINVTFTPTSATNPRTGTVTITDNASGNPQTVNLTGTATAATTPDFSLSFPSQTVTTAPGEAASFVVNVVSLGGFTTPVTFTCSGTIPQGSCVAPTGTVTPTAAPGTAATFTIMTKSLLVTPPSSMRTPPLSMRQIALLGLAALMLLMLPATRRVRTRFGLVGAMAMFIVLAGCSSAPSTPAGTYTLTVTGTAGSASHSATVTVNVN